MIREATIQDSDAIARVHVASWRATHVGQVSELFLDDLSVELCAVSWRETLVTGEQSVLLAIEDGSLAGFVCFGPSRDSDAMSTDTGEIYALYLGVEFQGRGLGRALWDAALSSLTLRFCTEVTVWVLASNSRPREFYEARGCQLDGEFKYLPLADEEHLELRYRLLLTKPALGEDPRELVALEVAS